MKQLKTLADAALVRGKDYNRLLELVMANRVQVNGTGLTLQRTASGVYLSTSHSRLDNAHGSDSTSPVGAGGVFVGKIKSNTAYADNIWNYTFVMMEKTSITGYETGSWAEAWTDEQSCFNLLEYANSGTGVQMNGVDVDGADFPATFALQPCPVGALVLMYTAQLSSTAGVEYWFQYASGVDGTCS